MHTSSGPTHLGLCGMSVLIIWILPRIGISEESPVPLNEGGVDGVDEQSSRSSNDDEPQSDPVPDDTPCSKIDCSGHGVCVIVKERPVCACEEGYVADPTTGLGCILPSTQPARKPVVRATPDYSDQIRPDREPFQSSGYSGYEYDRAAIRQVEALIPDLDIRKQYHRYRKSLERMRFSGSFNEYMRYQISVVKKRGTIAVLSAGALHALAGITFMIVAAATVNAVDGEETMAFYLAGGGNLIGAAIFLPVAAVRNTRNKRRLENLKGLQFKDEFSDY